MERRYKGLSEVYTVNDIMEILDIGKNTAYDLIKQEGFPAIKIKTTYRIPRQAFLNWMNNFNSVA